MFCNGLSKWAIQACHRCFSFSALLFVVAALTACQAGGPPVLTLDEAKKATATFQGQGFVAPPRTIKDITAILHQQPLADPEAIKKLQEEAALEPPVGADRKTLAQFYLKRGTAARKIGNTLQRLADLKEAARLSGDNHWETKNQIFWGLGLAENDAGNIRSSIRNFERAMDVTPSDRRPGRLSRRALLGMFYAYAGDMEKANRSMTQAEDYLKVVRNFRNWQRSRNHLTGRIELSKGRILGIAGRFGEAGPLMRSGVAKFETFKRNNPDKDYAIFNLDMARSGFARNLASQGKTIEAEVVIRKALTDALRRVGRYSSHVANMVRTLAQVITAQGRHAEAAQLANEAINIYQTIGIPATADKYVYVRDGLATSLANQGKWKEALAQYDIIGKNVARGSHYFEKYYASNLIRALSLVKVGRAAEAIPVAESAVKRFNVSDGTDSFRSARALGILALVRTVSGDRAGALADFSKAVPILLSKASESDDEESLGGGTNLARRVILESYIGVLADVRGTAVEREAGIDAVVESFRLADIARGQSVQRALSASGARAKIGNPELAELARREQDARKQISSLNALLADSLSRSTDQQDPEVVASLTSSIATLRAARVAVMEEITTRFPDYAELIDPKPATVETARAVINAGEALIATFVGDARTYVWVVPKVGPVAFAAADLGREDLGDMVGIVRSSLEPNAEALGDIPPFEVETAHDIYKALLAPVKAGWGQAESLLIVVHGPLGHLPLSVLPTESVTLPAESGALFSNHRVVPWLARTHSVTVLPSVSSLRTLRSLPPGASERKAFAGFGDPLFSTAQAAETRVVAKIESRGVNLRGRPIYMRAAPATGGLDSAQLARLPGLPDTSSEIKGIALALNADLTRDVFLGKRANEGAVKEIDLSGYKVLVFATHGLVPGDLDGLTQPALALSAPEVAGVAGDGLLTMAEILGLRLDADWVVLSACNTASGNGAGAEAVSGLGRAFFYAGTRALLVSNWPVETTSAKALTTDLFRRQHKDPTLTRAQALRQTMLAMIDDGVRLDPKSGKAVFSHAHPIFWAPFSLIGDGGGAKPQS